MNKSIAILSILLITFIVSCKHDVVEPDLPQITSTIDTTTVCDTSKVYFQNDILPILISSCSYSGCHDAGTSSSGVILTTYDNVMQSEVVKANDLADSDLYETIIETDPNERMPLGGSPLNSSQIDKIKRWILDGAKNTFCEVKNDCDTTNITFTNTISPIITNKCQGCHSGSRPGGGISLTNHAEIKIIANDASLLGAINHTPGYKAMPLGGNKLPLCEIKSIRIWIESGAPNN